MHPIAFELARHFQGSELGTQDLLKVCVGNDDWGLGGSGGTGQFFFGTIYFGLLFLAGSLAILFIFVSSARKEGKERRRELSSLPSSLFFSPPARAT